MIRMLASHILGSLIWLPLVSAAAISLIPSRNIRTIKATALSTSLALCILSIFTFTMVDGGGEFSMLYRMQWIPTIGASFHIGIDGISSIAVIAVSLSLLIGLGLSWNSDRNGAKQATALALISISSAICALLAIDLLLFSIATGILIITTSLITSSKNDTERISHPFITTQAMALTLFIFAAISMALKANSFDLLAIYAAKPDSILITIMLVTSFFIMIGAIPIHLWIMESCTKGSTLLSSISIGAMTTIGGYGFIRFALPTLPSQPNSVFTFIAIASAISAIGGAILAIGETNIKRIVAFLAVSQVGMMIAALSSAEAHSLAGFCLLLAAQPILICTLIALANILENNLEVSTLSCGGILKRAPRLSLTIIVILMAMIGLPGTAIAPGKMLVMLGTFQNTTWLSIIIMAAVILNACAISKMIGKVVFGKPSEIGENRSRDIDAIEILIISAAIVILITAGIAPELVLAKLWNGIDVIIKLIGL